MNGQLGEQPLAELIREISSKSLGGRLRLEHEKVQVVAYFESGNLIYAASNLRSLRLREYLTRTGLVTDDDLAKIGERVADTELMRILISKEVLTQAAADAARARLVEDVLRLALLWTDGSWEFESRSRLNEDLNLTLNIQSLLLEAGRRLHDEFVTSRFRNRAEKLSPVTDSMILESLQPSEAYLLSRLEQTMGLSELAASSGLGEAETVRLVYSLALAGLLEREHWKHAFRGEQPSPPVERVAPPPPTTERESSRNTEPEEIEAFLARVKSAQTHYDVLKVNHEASQPELKKVYYGLARRYHPDRFRKEDPALVTRIESAFARITQAYDTLRDDRLRATYNSKLEARKKAELLADAAPKATTPPPQPEPVADGEVSEPVVTAKERAEIQFKEGFAALELGQSKTALSLFAAAATAVPNEPRYRAFYGQLLAGHESTRRAAETELLAAIKLDPGNADYRVILAELYRDLGLKLRAKGEAERAVAADPNNRKARELLRALK